MTRLAAGTTRLATGMTRLATDMTRLAMAETSCGAVPKGTAPHDTPTLGAR